MKELGRSAPSSPFWRMIGSRLNGASQMAIPPKCGGAARPFKSIGRMNSEGAGGYGNRSCIAAVDDRETELVLFDERLRKRR